MRTFMTILTTTVLAAGCGELRAPPQAGSSRGQTTSQATTPTTSAYQAPVAGSEWAHGATTKAVANVGSTSAGETTTRLLVVDAATDANRAIRMVPGSWTLPAPVSGGAPEGLAWRGLTAVLADTDGPSRFAVVSLTTAAPAAIVDLRAKGTFSYDALSPDGHTLYLTERLDAAGKPVDRIIAYDLVAGVLASSPIVDKAEGGEAMVGVPVARTRSADGVAVYTIYERTGKPFLHELATDGGVTFCVDLPGVGDPAAPGTWTVSLATDGTTLAVRSTRLARTFTVDLSGGLPRVI